MCKKIRVIKDYLSSIRSHRAKGNNYYRMKEIDDIYQFVDLVERTKEEELDFLL